METGGWERISVGHGIEALKTAVGTEEHTKDLRIEVRSQSGGQLPGVGWVHCAS